MALKTDITIPEGTHVETLFPVAGPLTDDYLYANGYVRVVKVHAGREVATAVVELRTEDAAQPVCQLAPAQFAHNRASGAPEITEQAYTHLKALPAFASAVDC